MKGLLQTTFLAGPLQKAKISFQMVENGQPALSHHENQALIPASNMKLFISAAGLFLEEQKELFPPLITYSDGSVQDGTLKGNLLLDSCGSIIFSSRYPVEEIFKQKNQNLTKQVSSYYDQLRKAGVTVIEGKVALRFPRWNAPEENPHYTAASAFSFNENTVDTLVSKGIMNTVPEKPLVFKFAGKTDIEDQDKVKDNLIRFNPAVDSRDYWRISHYPATKYALAMLEREIRKQGIKILNKQIDTEKVEQKIFETASLYSAGEFIEPLNLHSDNFRAELLALLINRAISGKATYEGLNESLNKVFKSKKLLFPHLNADDGSGLSRKNSVSAKEIISLLKFMEKHKAFAFYKKSLAIAGKSGTLKNRFKNSPWEGSFYGKTGTLNGVSSLSGYWFRKEKPTVYFSFIGNGAPNDDFWFALEKFARSLRFML